MGTTFKNKAERDTFHAAMLAKYKERKAQGSTSTSRNQNRIEFNALQKDYLHRLPLVNLNVCPFCGHINKARLDPWGIEGAYWSSPYAGNRRGYEPDCCAHLFYYSGAFRFKIEEPQRPHATTARKTFLQNEFRTAFFPYTSAFPFIPGHEVKAEDHPQFVVGEVKIEGGHTLYPIGCYTDPPRTKGKPTGKWFSTTVGVIGTGEWDNNRYTIKNDIMDLINQKRVHWTQASEDNAILHNGPFEDYPHPYPSESYIKR
jgi:hypothetical protein